MDWGSHNINILATICDANEFKIFDIRTSISNCILQSNINNHISTNNITTLDNNNEIKWHPNEPNIIAISSKKNILIYDIRHISTKSLTNVDQNMLLKYENLNDDKLLFDWNANTSLPSSYNSNLSIIIKAYNKYENWNVNTNTKENEINFHSNNITNNTNINTNNTNDMPYGFLTTPDGNSFISYCASKSTSMMDISEEENENLTSTSFWMNGFNENTNNKDESSQRV
jgi:hypothetical protein